MNVFYHMYYTQGFLFIVATEIPEADEKAYEYLRSVQERFMVLRLNCMENYAKYSLSQHFKTELMTIMQQYNTNKKIWSTQLSMQSLGLVRDQVEEVTGIMRENVERVLDRGEALEDIVTRANDLQATTDVFHRQTAHINRHLYWRNFRFRLCLIFAVLVILTIIIVVVSVRASSDSTTTTVPPPTKITTVPSGQAL